MPSKPSPRIPAARAAIARRIGVMIFNNFQLLDAAGPISTFEMPARELTPSPYDMHVIAPDPGQVRSSSGASMYADPLPREPKYDTLIVAGGVGTRKAMLDPRVQQF